MEGATLNGIVTLLNAVAGLIASQQSQRNEIESQRDQINAIIDELRRSRAPSTTPHLNDTEPPQNLPPPPESPSATGKMEQGRTQAEGTVSKSIDTLSTTVEGLPTSQQSQEYEIEARKGQINTPIDEPRRPRALSTTPKSPPNRDFDLYQVEDVITLPFGPNFYAVRDAADTFKLTASPPREGMTLNEDIKSSPHNIIKAKSCNTPSRSDENTTPISIPFRISVQGGVRSKNTAPKVRAALLLAQSNSKSTPKIVATQKRLLYRHETREVGIIFPKRSSRLPEPMAYTDTDWGGSLTCYGFKIVGGPI